MRLEVAYLFIELEELAHEVFNAYDNVKKQQCTMVEATVVAKLAMDVIIILIATLQLRYPSLNTGLDFLDVVMEKTLKAYPLVWNRPTGLLAAISKRTRYSRSSRVCFC